MMIISGNLSLVMFNTSASLIFLPSSVECSSYYHYKIYIILLFLLKIVCRHVNKCLFIEFILNILVLKVIRYI